MTCRLTNLRRELIAWFERYQRDLPWRRRRDAYAVWLSEVMLQQTQVITVVPYFERFLARFPTVEALAHAELDEVLPLWSGLGYYARARNLHRAARIIAERGMPTSAEALRALPGLGPYTSAAIASFAFGEAVAVLDGNVARVLCRLEALDRPADQTDPLLRERAEAFLDRERPGVFNEAMIELGALICTPVEPRCLICPVSRECLANARGLAQSLPRPRVRPEKRPMLLACGVALDGGRVLLARRREKGLFGGLWELPSADVTSVGDAFREASAAGRSEIQERAREALILEGLHPREERPFASVRRTLTHRHLTLDLWWCDPCARSEAGAWTERRFVAWSELASLGLSTAMTKALSKVESRFGPFT